MQLSGFGGVNNLDLPGILGSPESDPTPRYFVTLVVAVLVFIWLRALATRTVFGLSLQGLRDEPARMRALGFHVAAHRVFAFFLAGIIAGTAGVLMVWFNSQISPGSIGVGAAIDVLVVAVVGGLGKPVGPYLGAILFVLLKNFAVDLVSADRFNTLIGLTFLAIVLFSPDGLLGILEKLKTAGKMPDLENRIVTEATLTPQDIHDRYHVLNGAIYGLASHGKWNGAFKPANRSRDIRGLYLAGGAAHPGPGPSRAPGAPGPPGARRRPAWSAPRS